MSFSKLIYTIILFFFGVGILIYLLNYGISTRSVPTLQEFMASTTPESDLSGEKNIATSSMSVIPQSTSTSQVGLEQKIYPDSVISTPTGQIRIQIANNTTERQRGLSGITSLADDEGILFIFPKSDSHGFWMKDMNFPIDIVWIDTSMKVAGISENISPDTYPQSFFPPKKVQYVLEVNAGVAKKTGFATGTIVSF